jgi:hypothetical protein
MLFLWTITKRGKIWLDGDAFRQIVATRLPAEFNCQEVSFVGDQSLLNIYITIPEQDDPQKRAAASDKIEEFFRPTGITVRIHWTRKLPDEYIKVPPIWKKPIAWAGLAGGVAAVANLGVRGVSWVIGAGLAGFAVSWLILSEEGGRLASKVAKDIKNIRR